MEIQRFSSSIESKDERCLVPELFEKVEKLRDACRNRGVLLGIGTTVRGPEAQARLWCRSKTPEDVERRREILKDIAPKLSSLLKPEYAGLGPLGSYHLPGQSWHQWGEALDVYANVDGRAVWEGSIVRTIADLCGSVGLYHSYNEKLWEPKSRHWHVQLRKKETPMLIRGLVDSWAVLEKEMAKRFDI